MRLNATKMTTAVSCFSACLLALPASRAAQDQPAMSTPQQQEQQADKPHAWRRASDVSPEQLGPEAAPDPEPASQPGAFNQAPPPPPNFSANRNTQAPAVQQAPGPQQGPPAVPPQNDNYGVPAHLTINPGTYVTVRINQWLSSDRNQQGDTFFGTLAQPIIVSGIVVAQRGQTVTGRVTEAQKAGRVEGTSRLGLELTGLTMVDGQQVSIQSQMISRTGSTSTGRDAGAIAGTTALGAALGAGVDWGRGAAIGAGAGAAAGIIGVLLTRGHPTVIYPESTLTFRTTAAIAVETDHAPQAFHYVESQDYANRNTYAAPPPARVASAPCYGCAMVPPPPGYYYGPGYYPYWGSGFSVYFGRPYYGLGRGYYRGFRR